MARYARIDEALTVTQWINLDDPSVIAPQKKWSDGGLHVRPVEEGAVPEYRSELAKLNTIITVEPTRVLITHTVVPHGEDAQKMAIKKEANRRILERLPDWKQANMIARQGELLRIALGQMIDAQGQAIPARSLTESEIAELVVINAAWDWVKAIRTKSNEIELISPIPNDFDASSRWEV